MNAHAFPERTANAIKIEKLIKMSDKRFLSDRMSTRMVKCASAPMDVTLSGMVM